MRARVGVPLAELSTLRVGGPAARLLEPDTEADVVAALVPAIGPVLVLGGGSNVVVSDEGFPGTVVRVATRGVTAQLDGAHVLVTLAAGEPWDAFVERAVAEGWTGVAALSGIPGLAGATPVQNVGAYGAEVADLVTAVRVLDRRTGTVTELPATECGFGYRTSRFKHQPDGHAVLGVTLRLRRDGAGDRVSYPELAVRLGVPVGAAAPGEQVRAAVLDLRRGKGMVLDAADHDTWSVGSFFTNPVVARADVPAGAPAWPASAGRVKTSAAWLLEQAGYGRGYGTGPVRLSSRHPLALTNRGGARAADVLALAVALRDGVRAAFGITLVPEPVLVGLDWPR